MSTLDVTKELVVACIEEMAPDVNTAPQLPTAHGDNITVEVHDGSIELDDDSITFPILRIQETNAPPPGRQGRNAGSRETTQQTTDDITFDDGTLVYQVDERDIDTINSVTGTLNGSPHTFAEGTDFEVHSTRLYSTDDAIEWLDGGDSPDDGTDFTVDYDHKLYEILEEFDYDPVYEASLFVPELNDGERGATRYYPKSRLASQLKDALIGVLSDLRGKVLVNKELRIGRAQAITRQPDTESGRLVRWIFEVQLKRRDKRVKDTLKAVGKTELKDGEPSATL